MFGLKPRHRTVATIGYPGHGKTLFLASLFWDSFFALSESFQDSPSERRKRSEAYSVRAVTDEAIKVFFGNARMLHDYELPPPNPRGQSEPATLEFQGVPSARRRRRRTIRLTFYDIAGEVFRDAAATRRYAPFVADADDLLFLFDPTREDFSALSAAELVNLVTIVAGAGRRQNLIIALSKMDALRRQDEWVDLLAEYWPDRPPAPEDLPRYMREMEHLSERLRDWWLDPARQAGNLIRTLPRNTRFCALSSLGHAPERDESGRLRLASRPRPFRVRDPLFWIFRSAGGM